MFSKFSPKGVLDASYGTGGVLETSLKIAQSIQRRSWLEEINTQMVLLPDDSLLIGYVSQPNATTLVSQFNRVLLNGKLDSSFGQNGVFTIPLEAKDYWEVNVISLKLLAPTAFEAVTGTTENTLTYRVNF